MPRTPAMQTIYFAVQIKNSQMQHTVTHKKEGCCGQHGDKNSNSNVSARRFLRPGLGVFDCTVHTTSHPKPFYTFQNNRHGCWKRGVCRGSDTPTIHVERILICISPLKNLIPTHANCMQHLLRCWERQSDGSEYKKTFRQPGLCPGPR